MTEHEPNPGATFLTDLLQKVESGESIYGPVGSPKQVEKAAELLARIDLGRKLGEIAPPPAPWAQRVREERLAQEHPAGPLATQPIGEEKAAFFRAKFDRLADLGDAQFARLADATAKDIADHASPVTLPHAMYSRETGAIPSGHVQVDALVADATPAVEQFATTPAERAKLLQLIRADRGLLEFFAARGRASAAYHNRRQEIGL